MNPGVHTIDLVFLRFVYRYTLSDILIMFVSAVCTHNGLHLPHLRESWLKSTSVSVLDKSLDKTKVSEMCCLEIVSYIRLKGQRVNNLTY